MPDRTDLAEGFSPASIRKACAAIGMSDASTRILVETAAALAGSETLRAPAIRCADLVFGSSLPLKEAIAAWPVPADRTGLPPFFDPTVILAGFRRLVADHRRRGIPPEVTQRTLRDLDLWMDHFLASTGTWSVHETFWIAHHFTSRLFQLGRLQFESRAMDLPFVVFTSSRDSSVAILAEGGRVVRPDGQFADADGCVPTFGSVAERSTWSSRFIEDERGWRGSAVDPAGRVQPGTVTLDRDTWIPVARRGDPALAVHIPAAGRFNGPLTREACAEAFRRAIPFFAKHLPGIRPRLLTCTSWMLDPQLARHLAPDSNLAAFQRLFRLVPVPAASDRQTLERIFGGPVADWSKAPRDTSLRRIVADQARAGVHWRMGGGVMLPRDAAMP